MADPRRALRSCGRYEGIGPETVFKIGSCMQEVLEYYHPAIEASDAVGRLGLSEKDSFVVNTHREENANIPDNLCNLVESVNGISKEFDKTVVFSFHPRTRKRLDSLGMSIAGDRMHILKPLGFLDYIKLQKQAFWVISDSGTITEESSLLGFPAITIRQAHERPEGMDAGTLIMSDLKKHNVIRIVTGQCQKSQPVKDYQSGAVSRKVLHIILSYTDYIKRTVWRVQ